MRAMDRDNQISKKETGDQAGRKAAKARPISLNGLLETVREKMAYTIRGI